MLGVGSTNLLHHVRNLLAVPLLVHGEAQAGDSVDHGATQLGALLTDAASKDQSIDLALKGDIVGADEAADAIDKNVKGETVLGVVRLGYDTEVGGAGESLPAGTLVEYLLSRSDVEIPGGCGREFADVTGVVKNETGRPFS